jgi:hypothetical protein
MRVALLLACAAISCQPSYGSMPVYGAPNHDTIIYPLQGVNDARARAHQEPNARNAVGFAKALHAAAAAGTYGNDGASFRRDADDAIAVLDQVLPNAGPDASILLAWEGNLLSDEGRGDDALRTLLASQKMGPNLVAASTLIPAYGGLGRRREVGEICNATVPVLIDPDAQYALIETCNRNMNALSDDTALAWARPEIAAWYRQEHARRAATAAAEEERRRAREDAQAQRAAEREAYENRVVREAEICADECKERGLSCQNRCDDDQDCEQRCVESNHACVDACASRGYMRLGR